MNAITNYAKAHVALILAVLTWLVTALKDGTVSGQEWVGLPAAILTGLGVAAVRNRKVQHNDAGYGLIELLVAVILLVLLVLLILWLIPHHH